MKLKLLVLVCALLLAVPLFGGQPERCGTRQPSDEEIAAIEQAVQRGQKGKTSAVVDVWVHVISAGAGYANGEISDAMIREQMRVLDESYNGRTGGANTGFGFELVGVTRTTNATWFSQTAFDLDVEMEMKTALRRGGPGTLNIYTLDGGPWLGWAYFPSILNNATYANLDGVVLDWRSLPGGTFEIYSEGDTATHEVGHWLALYHTFDGRCGKFGDYVSDTPSEFSPAFRCPVGRDSCAGAAHPGLDPIHNFMDYSDDACYTEFSGGQSSRMTEQYLHFRAP